jgi:hypothetical protein
MVGEEEAGGGIVVGVPGQFGGQDSLDGKVEGAGSGAQAPDPQGGLGRHDGVLRAG